MDDTIDQFMWGFQPHFRIRVELGVGKALSQIGLPVDVRVVLVGFALDCSLRHQLCIEPEAGPLSVNHLDGVLLRTNELLRANPESGIRISNPRYQELRRISRIPPFTLLIAVDDATGTVVDALFCEKEDAHSYFLLIQRLLQRRGIPLALYTDRHGVFRHTPGSGLPGMPTQFSRAMDELGIQMIFALSPQAKGRVERMAETFQDRLVTELRLAGASSIGEANSALEQFLPRFNRRFRVPPQYPEPAFRPLDPELCLEQILCFKHRRKVARDNTVRFQLHTLQLLPERERPSYAGAAVEVLQGLAGRLSVRHEGRIISSQEAPPSPVFLRNGHGSSESVPVRSSSANGLGEHWISTLEPLDSRAEDENGGGLITDGAATPGRPAAAPTRKPTFLQKERWKAIQKARRKGMSLRAIERELGIHRATIKKYTDAEGPPTRQSRVVSETSSSDTIEA